MAVRRVALVLPDAGPLISLALGEALDLLLRLDVPVWVVDAVLAEVTASPDRPVAAAVDRFVRDHPGRVRVAQTLVGELARARRAERPEARTRGLGEAAAAEFLARLDEFVATDAPVLVLFEDSDVRRIQAFTRGDVHLLSTRALLTGMERVGLIASADAVWRRIEAAGRSPSRAEVDRPSPEVYGGSVWLPVESNPQPAK